jgi:hypothetical protein
MNQPKKTTSSPIKVERTYSQNGENKSRWDTVGWLTEKSNGMIRCYIDLPLIDKKLVVFHRDQEEGQSLEEGGAE